MNGSIFLYQLFFILLFNYGAYRIGRYALTTSVAIQAILANFFVLKQISFLGFHITCSDGFAVGSIMSLNFLREFYSKEDAKIAIKICFFFMIFFVVMSQLHLQFIPSAFDTAHPAYTSLLSPSPRLLIASLTTFWLIQQFDLRAFGWISHLLPRSSFLLRNSISLIISQFFDTVLFSILGLAGLVARLGDIILVSFVVKVSVILILSPLMGALRKWGKYV